MATDKISSPLDRLVDVNNKKNLVIKKNIKRKHIYLIIGLWIPYTTNRKTVIYKMKSQNKDKLFNNVSNLLVFNLYFLNLVRQKSWKLT
jgi:uncharacterized membrane protein